MSNAEPDQLVPQELLSRLFQRKVIPFFGAGCSVPAPSRLPTARELARALVERGAGSDGQALEDIAEEAWAQGDWPAFAQLLPIGEWRARPPNLVSRVVAELCRETLIGQILTTNWDLLIESALGQIGQPYSKVVDAQSLAVEPSGTVTLIKLNGCGARASALQQIETAFPKAAPRRSRRTAVQEELAQQHGAANTAKASVATTTAARETVRRRLAEVRAAIDAAKAMADQFAAVLLSAEAFVRNERCPVCEQTISPDDVRARLRERADQLPEPLRALEEERQQLEARDRNLGEQIAPPQASLATARDRIAALEDDQRRLDEAETGWQSALAGAGLGDDPDPAEISAQRQLEATRAASADRLVVAVDGVLAKARYLASEDRRSRLADEEARLRAEHASAVASAQHVRTSRTLLQDITRAAKESELEIVKRLMFEQKPLLNALYRRLRPHPVLDQLDIEFGQFSQRGEVYFEAVAGEKRANASAIFSSAQLNAVAICVFLATNVSAGETRFALLDDPIQNMDDFNVLGLLDLLRSVSSNRQVVVSTHDLQLGELMRRKLRPSS